MFDVSLCRSGDSIIYHFQVPPLITAGEISLLQYLSVSMNRKGKKNKEHVCQSRPELVRTGCVSPTGAPWGLAYSIRVSYITSCFILKTNLSSHFRHLSVLPWCVSVVTVQLTPDHLYLCSPTQSLTSQSNPQSCGRLPCLATNQHTSNSKYLFKVQFKCKVKYQNYSISISIKYYSLHLVFSLCSYKVIHFCALRF